MKTYLNSIKYIYKGEKKPVTEEEFCVGIETSYEVYTFMLGKSNKLVSDHHLLYYGSSLRLGERGREDETVYERNYHAKSPDGALIGPFENEAHGAYPSFESRRTFVDLRKLSHEVDSIMFCIAKPRQKGFDTFEDEHIHARLYKDSDWLFGTEIGETIVCTDFCDGIACLTNLGYQSALSEEYTDMAIQDIMARDAFHDFGAAEILSLTRTGEGWMVCSIGNTYQSIDNIIDKYSYEQDRKHDL